MFYSICYDASGNHRRLKVAKLLEDFGERVQYSVFEANVEREELDRLKRRAMSILDPEEDFLRIYPLCAGCMRRIEVLGQGKITEDPEFIIV
jgi:CRISPR-associated protein Cas2